MPRSSTSSSPELLVALDRRAGTPLRGQLERQLRDAIRAGRLAPGTAVPSSRELARQLSVSRGLAVSAYAQLVAEGYLVARRGAATRVSDAAAPADRRAAPLRVPPRWRYDLRPGAPDLALFPRRAWLASARRAVMHAPDVRLDYGDPRGAPELRAALAGYLGRVRGVVARPESVIVTSGLAQGVGLVARTLHRRGARRAGIEDPGSAPVRVQLAALGLEILPVPVDGEGVRVDGVDRLDALLLTPAHHFPTGVVLSPGRRNAVLDWARAAGALILEDDYDAEYRYDRPAVGALQGLAPDQVVYAGSVSKTLAPGLRLGWVVVPDALAGAVAHEKALDDLGTPIVDQLTLADFLERGELDRHLRATRLEYRRRRDALVAALARSIPAAEVDGVAAGLHLMLRLPAGTGEAAALAAARARGIGLGGLSENRVGPGPPALLLGYGRIPVPTIEAGVHELAAALEPVSGP